MFSNVLRKLINWEQKGNLSKCLLCFPLSSSIYWASTILTLLKYIMTASYLTLLIYHVHITIVQLVQFSKTQG